MVTDSKLLSDGPQRATSGLIPTSDCTPQTAYHSTEHVIRRYCQLYELMSFPRSIPLGSRKTHVGKTDSHGRWQKIQAEMGYLFRIFPKINSPEWCLLLADQQTNLMPKDRLRWFQERTGLPWSSYVYGRRKAQTFAAFSQQLRDSGVIPDEDELKLAS